MKITAIEPMLVRVPLREPVHGVHGLTSLQESVLVRVTTDAGPEGWGNVDPTPGYSKVTAERVHAMVERLAPRLAGTDALDIATAHARMAQDGAAASEARAAVEMALLDLKARTRGVPLHALLGTRVKDTVTLNAWIGTVAPAQAAREAVAWGERGFRTAKIKISGATDEGVERVAAVRAAVRDRMALRVDFNESLTLEQAPAFIRRLEPYALTLVEQPIPRTEIAGLARIRAEIGIPLMADESVTDDAALAEIIRLGAADLVKVKVMKQGGLLPTLTTIGRAKAAGLRVVLGHGFGLTLSTIAEATVAAVSDAVIDGCEAVGPLKMAGDVVAHPARLDAGVIHLPDAPGLGVAIDPEALERYRVR